MGDDMRSKLAVALHDADCGDRHCEPQAMGAYYRQADIALAVMATVPDGAAGQVGGNTSAQQPELLRRAGVAIRMCFELATRELLADYVEELDDDGLAKLVAAADHLHTVAQYALGRRHS